MNNKLKISIFSLLLINCLLISNITFSRDYYIDLTGKGRPPDSDTKDGYFARYPKMQEVADYGSFKILYQAYGSDKNNVYFKGEILDGVNPENFHVLRGRYNNDQYYAKNNEGVYIKGELIPEADPESFQLIERINPRDPSHLITMIYASDKNSLFINGTKIPDSDPESFFATLSGIGFDKYQVYYWDNALKGSDPASFKMINEYFFKDKNHLYYKASRVDGADPQSLVILIDNFFTTLIKDKNNVYVFEDNQWKKLPNIDANSFEQFKNTDLFFDKNAFYSSNGNFLIEKIEGQKISIKEISRQKYLKIDDHCYNKYRVIECE